METNSVHQAAHTAAVDQRDRVIELLDIDEACIFFGGQKKPINRVTLYRGINAGRYPAPIKIGPNSSRWIKAECAAALAVIIEARGKKAA